MVITDFFLNLSSLAVRSISCLRNKLYDSGLRPGLEPPLLAISLGNISFGGTGKTPLALFLLSFLRNEGWRPCFISRGYRGRWEKRGGLVSDGQKLLATWREAGDEPFMVARRLPDVPVIVGRKRFISCLRAFRLGCNVAVLDDAFQHRQLKRHLDIVLLSPEDKAQRESWSALKRASLILVQGQKKRMPDPALKTISSLKIPPPVFTYELRPLSLQIFPGKKELSPEELRWKRVIAFCGLARPENFRHTLNQLGARVENFLTFPDHYAYPDRALKKIAGYVKEKRPEYLVTTEKDAVKLIERSWFSSPISLAVLKVDFVPEPEFISFLKSFLEKFKYFQARTNVVSDNFRLA